MNRMRKLLCPQCKISGMYVKNATGERLLVYVSDKGEVIPKYEDVSMVSRSLFTSSGRVTFFAALASFHRLPHSPSAPYAPD